MNYVDIAVLLVLALCVYAGYRRGLLRMVFRVVSFFASLWLSYLLYPHVGGYLRRTPLYGLLKNHFIQMLDLRAVAQQQAEMRVPDILRDLALPDALLGPLERFNTPDVYALLRVESIEEYIGGFFANIVLQFIAMIVVFFAVSMVMRLIGNALDIAGRAPVLSLLNRAGGLAAGLVIGVAVVWAGLYLVNLFFANPAYPEIDRLMRASAAVKWFLEYEWMFTV